ncbi:MAG: DUF2723 domain-containing protein [Bacteroidaceae bacterium]|nr:DUF2723 domain-containing protein [Bacteroidaceae bacterium]
MRVYKIVNNLMGWFIFLIAAFTYCSTIEPTASFWDCPEFITTAYKFEVGHPPGAPFFMLLGKLFTLFASDATQVAKMVNTMSAMLSAGCILFLFWSITHLARVLIHDKSENMSIAKTVAIMASGVAGALIYTWSDTFWFSAVEGEVYAFSSFMTALVFWLILKWEDNADEPHSDRWLVLIAYLAGISIGVHLLNLLCIPAIVLVFYYKKGKNPNVKGSLLVLLLSFVIIAVVLWGIIPGIVKMGAWSELMFVNEFGCPFNTGFYIYLTLLVITLAWALYESYTDRSDVRMKISFLASVFMLGVPFMTGTTMSSFFIGLIILAAIAIVVFKLKALNARVLNTAVLCMTLITVGYSSYAIVVIRSGANPPMDQNSPEDAFALQEYLNREQYGDRPLLYGQAYTSKPELKLTDNGYYMYNTKSKGEVWQRQDKENPDEPDKYIKIRDKLSYVYPSNQMMIFPRIYDEGHARDYEDWLGGVEGHMVNYNRAGQNMQIKMPSQADNLRFFFSYQLNFMYLRYFMWNFVGRQNDIQSNGELEHGQWVSGIPFIDNLRLGDQSLLPSDLQNNKGHNVFYFLPLILGLLGLFWQSFKGDKGVQQFWVVFFLFFLTGIAIVVYLNQTPVQPRERDYAYAGSFYAFAIWCGLGITAIYDWLSNMLSKRPGSRTAALAASLISVIPAIAVPVQMVSQTWDDHDRSDRYVCRDFGLNYLETIPHNGVIYTNGDNDTFPLWYNEDTEGNRTDVRVCNLSYLNTDWYIDQMKRPAYEGEGQSTPLPIDWTRLQYASGKNEVTDVNPTIMTELGEMPYKEFVLRMYKEDPETAKSLFGEQPFELKTIIHNVILNPNLTDQFRNFPSDTVYVTVDKEAVRKSGMMIPDSIPDRMVIDLSATRSVYKNLMMVLEMISQTNFSRPLYMATTVGSSNYGHLFRNFVQEGLAYRITPFTFEENAPSSTIVDADKMFDNMVNKYHYGNMSQEGLYVDETVMRMCLTHRRWFSLLINTLVEEGDVERARIALNKVSKELPDYNVPHTLAGGSLDLGRASLLCGMVEEGNKINDALIKNSQEYLRYYYSLSPSRFAGASQDAMNCLYTIEQIRKTYETLAEEGADAAGNPYSDSQIASFKKKASDYDSLVQTLFQTYQARTGAGAAY